MTYHVLTLFPDMIRQAAGTSILGRALRADVIGLDVINIRDFSDDKNMRVDDYPYGGGAGMVMRSEPVFRAVQQAKNHAGEKARVIYMTPQAPVLTQVKAEELALEDDLIILCGHYEGIDERVLEETVTDYISIGDYVLTGGELAACVLIDAVSRFVPGVLSNDESSQFESLQDELLEYPHYTRPEVWHDKAVPEVLRSGDHEKVAKWRYERSVERTKERRPDLYKKSLSVHTLLCGDTAAAAESINGAVSRYGELLDYNRNKLRKQKRTFGKHDMVIFAADNAQTAEAAFANIKGSGTRTVLLICAPGEEKDFADFKEQLSKAGFAPAETYALPEEMTDAELKKLALRIRK